jgi:hypothetical protein
MLESFGEGRPAEKKVEKNAEVQKAAIPTRSLPARYRVAGARKAQVRWCC